MDHKFVRRSLGNFDGITELTEFLREGEPRLLFLPVFMVSCLPVKRVSTKQLKN
jgi:hypothetical protein